MAVKISGVLKDGAGKPVVNCAIELRARRTSPTVVAHVVATCVTDNNGAYVIEAEPGYYEVALHRNGWQPTRVGDIYVAPTDAPGTLNAFLDAPKDGDLRPEVMKRFEEMVDAVARQSEQVTNDRERAEAAAETATNAATSALDSKNNAEELKNQAQQNAEATAESERQAGQHVADAQKIKEDCQTQADNVQQNAEAVAEDKRQVAQLASSATQDAARAEQAVKDADAIVQKAVDKLADAATLTGEAKASAEAAAKSEQNAKSHADNAAGSAQQTAQDVTATETARDDAERFANEAENSAQTSGTARDESVDAAGRASQYKEAASSAATSAENAANKAQGHENNAAEYARQAKASQDASAGNAQEAKQHRDEAQRIVDDLKGSNATTTEKGLVQLCSDTDNDSEELAATPKAVKVVMDETNTKAPLDSPAFTGTPTTPTPPDDATGLEMANAAFVRKLLAALVDSSPEALDTLNELAAALGNDPNFATTVTKALAGKQPLNDVLTAVGQITPRKNSLLYYNESGNLTLTDLTGRAKSLLGLGTYEKMRALLELKAAATMDPQSDIRDRTPGRLALSGMHGFGQAFASADALAFEGLSDFVEWLKKVTPGRYAVSITDSSQLLTGTTQFNGIIDVMWFPYANSESDTVRKFKTLMCYNQYYQGEHCIHYMQYRYNDSDNSWNMSSRVVVYDGDSLAYLLSRTAGSGSYFKYPAVGVPVLAVYRGTTSGDKEIKIGLGDVVPGSCLGSVNITCSISAMGVYSSTPRVGASAYSFPGRYMAISGDRGSYGEEGHICLFVRIE
ncbi:prophage tail fiber N-terminal domain-containing protein [Escherichia coli]|nr:prophage tail fiber N-terminal domain-containing protein [Escherichia coli]QMM36847.1 prophage tail fiber N-terminal domain-containing protein [Escherichia coli]QMM55568.1 prophage tail fiber N-terminal domain-containing protein [Escherichia coli]QMS09811.1 prophage tail fiber N-terminal domain-containing protein [Escherichia coli]